MLYPGALDPKSMALRLKRIEEDAGLGVGSGSDDERLARVEQSIGAPLRRGWMTPNAIEMRFRTIDEVLRRRQ